MKFLNAIKMNPLKGKRATYFNLRYECEAQHDSGSDRRSEAAKGRGGGRAVLRELESIRRHLYCAGIISMLG